jgi:hypothetical protein
MLSFVLEKGISLIQKATDVITTYVQYTKVVKESWKPKNPTSCTTPLLRIFDRTTVGHESKAWPQTSAVRLRGSPLP